MKLVYFSPQQNLKEIDPKFKGSGVDARARGRDTEHPHSFFYTEGSEPEDIVRSGAKSKYTISLSPEQKIYDIGTDPDHLVRNAIDNNRGIWNMDVVHGALKSAGYHGFRNTLHPQLPHVVAVYHPQKVHTEEVLGKSANKVGLAAAMLGASLLPQTPSFGPPTQIKQSQQGLAQKEKMRFLDAVSQVESAGGKMTDHAPVYDSMHGGERAYGAFGLMPLTIRETVKNTPALQGKYKKAETLKGQEMHDFMKKHPELGVKVASEYYDKLLRLSGGDRDAVALGWLNGPTGMLKRIKSGQNPSDHWYVKRVRNALGKR